MCATAAISTDLIGARYRKFSILEHDIVLPGLEHMSSNLACLCNDPVCGEAHGSASDADRPRADAASPEWYDVGVAIDHANARVIDPEELRQDLRKRGLVALPVVVGSQQQGCAAGRVEANLCDLVANAACAFDDVCHADAAQPPTFARLRAPAAEILPRRHFEDGGLVLCKFTAVIGEHEAGLVRHCRRRNQIALPQLVRCDTHLVGSNVDNPLQRIGCFRPAGTTIRRGRCRIAEDTAHVDMNGRGRIDAGQAAKIVDRAMNTGRRKIGAEIHGVANAKRQEMPA